MPYNSTGGWDYESDDVSSRIAKIASGGSPLMKQAANQGLQVANRRGLANSSMAVGASQAEVIRAAAPIASQEAQQAYGKNLQEQQGRQQSVLQSAQLAAAERQALLTATTDLSGQRMNALAATLQNEKIPGSARAAVQTSFNDLATQQQRYIESLYGVKFAPPAPPPPTTPAAGTTPGRGGFGSLPALVAGRR